ncbi:MAG: carbamoyl-phosphate synthase large subunit [Clostridia bacterium]|nr:carbamoyl-phosphate synthase large subunit [Clostridia bacterium]
MFENINRILVIGSGPIVIGSGAEYDYFAVSACRALKQEGKEIILVNSNPVSVSTDSDVADSVYIEPLSSDIIKKIIVLEKPDAILTTVGGLQALEIGLELSQNGFLKSHNVELLGVNTSVLTSIQDRISFKKTMKKIGENVVAAKVVNKTKSAVEFAEEIGLPVIVRPAYKLGGTFADFCYNHDELIESVEKGLGISLIHQVMIEKCISGWKEIEFEVIRDIKGNCVSVSSLENIDPVGIHTGDSIIVIPAQTLTDSETAMLRASALNIVTSLEIVGNCNVRFALKPDGSEFAVIGVSLGAGRSSSLVSKATGYSIPFVAAKVSIGMTLDEIKNEITGCTTACSEPAVDYCAVKFPKWSFESFSDVDRKLGVSMQATGQTLSIGTSFELAFMKGIRSVDSSLNIPTLNRLKELSDDELLSEINFSSNERIFMVYEAIFRGISFETIYKLTSIDYCFLSKLKNISDMHKEIAESFDEDTYYRAKSMGFTDRAIEELTGEPLVKAFGSCYKTVDTCAAEFDAEKPYFYSAFDDENEVELYAKQNNKKKILVIGSGASVVGYSNENDYCNVHSLKQVSKSGYEALFLSNNPDAVSTSYDISDRLYFDPITHEDILNLIESEKPYGILTHFSGKNFSDITKKLLTNGYSVLGINAETLEIIENSDKLAELLNKLSIRHSVGERTLGKVLLADIISDGEDTLIPGISEHIEKADVHYGDAISICPPLSLQDKHYNEIYEISKKIAKELNLKGLLGIQFSIYDNLIYVIGLTNNNARTIPHISKTTSVDTVEIAVRCMLGEKLCDIGCGNGIIYKNGLVAVRVPVFSFDKLEGADTQLGRKMKSTGEVLALAETFDDALLKAVTAGGMRVKRSGNVLLTVTDSDKHDLISVADKFSQLGFRLHATAGTARMLNFNMVPTNAVRKIHEGTPNTLDLVNNNLLAYVISTSGKKEENLTDDILIRRQALKKQIPVFTTVDTARAFVRCLSNNKSIEDIEPINISVNKSEDK